MNINANRMRKITLLGVCAVLAIVLALVLFNNNQFNAFAMSADVFDEYLYDQDFEEDNLVVVLDEKISEVNKVHKADFFKGIEIDHIIDLTRSENNNGSKNSDFRQILQIFLKTGQRIQL